MRCCHAPHTLRRINALDMQAAAVGLTGAADMALRPKPCRDHVDRRMPAFLMDRDARRQPTSDAQCLQPIDKCLSAAAD